MKWTKHRAVMISAGLTVLSVALALIRRTPACLLAALAMAISTFADALLAGIPDCFARVKDRLTKGGLVFFCAHILYILALILSSGKDISALWPLFTLPFAVFFAVTAAHGAVFYFRPRSSVPRSFYAASSLYLLTVGIHAAAAVTVYRATGGGYTLNVAGTLLFYLSDSILLAQKYGSVRGKHVPAMIWASYIPAQFCLIFGFFLA